MPAPVPASRRAAASSDGPAAVPGLLPAGRGLPRTDLRIWA